YNRGKDNQTTFIIQEPFTNNNVFPPENTIVNIPSTVHALNRTEGTLSFGREYYVRGSARNCEGCRWRIGWDVGMRWGTTRLDLNFGDPDHFNRLNSWNYGPVGSLHSDLEIPHGCCTFYAGFRVELDDTFNNGLQNVLHFSDNGLADVNLLLTLGV